jgi:para-aminobenzoate synthetase component 1
VDKLGCKLHCKHVNSQASPAQVTEVFSKLNLTSILGGNNSGNKSNRFSTWAAEPKETFTFKYGEHDPFGKLQEVLDKYFLIDTNGDRPTDGMFRGGWIGYFSYDLDQYIEKIPKTAVDDLGIDLIRLCFYDRAVCYDNKDKKWSLIVLEIEDEKETAEDKLNQLKNILTKAETIRLSEPAPADVEAVEVSNIRCNMTQPSYLHSLAKIRRYIYDGEVYQINFSQRFECDYTADPIELFHWQNTFNASPYAAFIDAGNFSIVSASPEMFLTVQNGKLSTKPIKGTRPRVANVPGAKQINEANFAELVESEKDQAELNMIIDLERNDITRVCKYGTIKVTQPRTIEEFPTVFHAVATVEGELYEGMNLCDILKATFPGGSITGAPKIRSMEIIDELEPTQRSVYTGSIGFIGVDGSVCLNIAIRTVIIKGDTAYVQTGGGIVADSDANDEWDETITKARALLAGIKAIQQQGKNVTNNK